MTLDPDTETQIRNTCRAIANAAEAIERLADDLRGANRMPGTSSLGETLRDMLRRIGRKS